MSEPNTFANPAVLEFYKTLPFNYRETVEGSVQVIQETDQVAAYPILKPLLGPGVRVLDVGSGAGWFSNSMAYRHGASVTGIDFNPVAVARAQEVGRAMKLDTHFQVADLFTYEPERKFDVVVSIGVLHHTDNCHAAIRRVCEHYVRSGGHVFIGLYHTYGRKPLLDHFDEMKQRGATENEMLERYTELHSQLKDKTHLRSWFRDQVLHPHETQHTMEEMMPLLKETGMELVSTSINRFQPIESLSALYEEEKKYFEIGVQRLKENQYFTGFFVFLARKAGGAPDAAADAGSFAASRRLLDSKPYIEHHPIFGYRYIPGTDMELPRPGGGRYHIQVNSDGIRADREYDLKKAPGTCRIIVCGDSMSAGQYVTNSHRFSELLERRIPGLEVINLSLEGSGTDQQCLLYEDVGLKYEHDLVILLPYLQNVRRNMVEAREGIDPKTGLPVMRPKPRFELVDGRLELRNVPVPKEISAGTIAKDGGADVQRTFFVQLKARLGRLPGAAWVKRLLFWRRPSEPFPEYKNPQSAEWRLMEAIIHRFKELAGTRPLVVAPTVRSNYVRSDMALNYWDRYASLAEVSGIYPIHLLPHFKAVGAEASRCFQEPHDMHFSAYGNIVLADAIECELRQAGLLPR